MEKSKGGKVHCLTLPVLKVPLIVVMCDDKFTCICMYVTITDVWFLYEHGQTLLYLFTHCTQMQEASNKAAVRYDKAASQHSAAKEMITMAEKQLGDHFHCVDHTSSSPIDLAWQEMLNHATQKASPLHMCLIPCSYHAHRYTLIPTYTHIHMCTTNPPPPPHTHTHTHT